MANHNAGWLAVPEAVDQIDGESQCGDRHPTTHRLPLFRTKETTMVPKWRQGAFGEQE